MEYDTKETKCFFLNVLISKIRITVKTQIYQALALETVSTQYYQLSVTLHTMNVTYLAAFQGKAKYKV